MNITQKTLCFIMFFLLHNTYSQQWEQTNGPEGATVYSILVYDSTLLAGGWGEIYRRTMSDGMWKSSENLKTSWDIDHITRQGQTIFALAQDHEIFSSMDTGVTWKSLGSSTTQLLINTLASDDISLYGGTKNGTVYISKDKGISWQKISSTLSITDYIISIAVMGKYIIICTRFDSGMYRLTQNGSGTWIAGDRQFDGIDNHLLVKEGPDVYVAGENGVFRSTDSGATWKSITSNIPVKPKFVTATTGGLYAVNSDCKVYESLNNGGLWSERSPARFSLGEWPMCMVASGTHLYIGVQGNGIVHSPDLGTSWSLLNDGLRQQHIFSMVNCKGHLVVNSEMGWIFISDDNGGSWRRVDPAQHGKTQVRCLASKGTSVFAGTWGAGIFRSDDFGASWVEVNQYLTDQYIVTISVCDSTIYAGSTDNCFQSRDNGARWIASMSGLSQNCYVKGVAKTGDLLLTATANSVYKSTDYGANWVPSATGLNGRSNWTITTLGKYAYVGTMSGIFRTADSGKTWTPSDFGMAYKDVFVIKNVNGMLLAGTNNGYVYMSRDSGALWNPVGSEIMPKNNRVEALTTSDDFIFAGTQLSSVWKFPLSSVGLSNRTHSQMSNKNGFISIITNKKSGLIDISYNLVNSGNVTISVTDMAGRMLGILKNSLQTKGQHRVISNVNILSPGCYFIYLKTSNFKQIARVMLR